MSKVVLTTHAFLGKICRILGCFISIPFFLVTILAISMLPNGGKLSTVFIMLLYTLVGVALVVSGTLLKRRIRRYREYVHLISEKSMTSFAELARATRQSSAYVKNDLQSMIKSKYFSNATIEEGKESIVIWRPFDGVDATGLDLETVICISCGAKVTKRRNTVSNCEYCGSLIA